MRISKQNLNKKNQLPESFRPYLWSYDFSRMDKERDKKLIITQVLNFGMKKDTDKLFSMYTKEDAALAIKHPMPGAWDKKSIHYWSLVLDTRPGSLKRNIPK